MHAAPGPLLPSNVVAAALCRRDPAHPLVAALLAGDAIASWAYSEPAPNDGLGRVDLEIREAGVEVVLNGVKAPVEAAASSSHLLVTGRTGDGLTQVLVPTDAPGITLTPMKSVDLTRRFSMVRFDGVRVPTAAVSVMSAAVDRTWNGSSCRRSWSSQPKASARCSARSR